MDERASNIEKARMKVRFLKQATDGGDTFQAGEERIFPAADGMQLVLNGYAEIVLEAPASRREKAISNNYETR